MVGTLISLLIAAYFLIINPVIHEGVRLNAFAGGLLVLAALIGSILAFLYANVWSALQRAELKATPRVTELFHSDRFLYFARSWSAVFILAIFFITIDLTAIGSIKKSILFAITAVLLGVTLDIVFQAVKVMSDYLSPTLVLKHFRNATKECVKDEHYGDFCAWLDAMSEVGLHAVHSIRLSLCLQAVDDLHEAIRHFLKASKSISHHFPKVPEEGKSQAMDTVSYVLLYAFQRLEMINDAAIRTNLEPVCSNIVSVLGKISIDAAQYDITLAQYPLHYMGRLTRSAVEKGLAEVSAKATSALLVLSKALPNKVDLTYLEIAPFYTAVIGQLDENAKAIFRKDKTTSIGVLLQPFVELKGLFEKGKLENHQDTSAIKLEIDNVVSQYKTLEEVMQSMTPFGVEGVSAKNVNDEGLSTKIVDDLEQRLREPKVPEEEST